MLSRPRIRQLSLGELLDESFRIYRRDLLTLIALAALVFVPYTILNALITLPLQQNISQLQNDALVGAVPDDQLFNTLFSGVIFSSLLAGALGLLSAVVFTPLMEGALTRAVMRRYLDQPVSIGDSIGAALRRALPLIVAKLLPSIGLLVLSIVFIACAGLAIGGLAAGGIAALGAGGNGEISPGGGAGVAILVVLLAFALGVTFLAILAFLYVRFLFTSQTVMAEGKGPIEALGRSWNLTKGSFWRTFGIFLVVAILTFLVQLVPSSILTAVLLVPLARGAEPDLVQQQLLSTVVTALTSVLTTPFQLVAFTLMYFDLRIRKEGFDLEQQARALMPDANTGYTQPFNP